MNTDDVLARRSFVAADTLFAPKSAQKSASGFTPVLVPVVAAVLVAGMAIAPNPGYAQTAEDASSACQEAVRLIADDDLDGALDEAKWCVESLEQLRDARTLTLFPESLEGFERGEIDRSSGMGMTFMNATYSRGEDTIDVSLTSGAAGSGLAALAQLGLGLGGEGGKKIRIQKRTVLDMSEQPGEAQLLVQLKSGGVLTISSETVPSEEVVGFARGFPIAELDDALIP